MKNKWRKKKMVRPRILKDSKIISLVMERLDMEIVEKERGDQSFSSYVRNLIRETQSGVKKKTNSEKILKKELRETKAKLDVFERKEMAITQERRDTMKDISKSYNDRLTMLPDASLDQQQNWLESRCKGTGISPIEMTAYIKNPDVFSDKMLEKEQKGTNL